MKNNILIGIVGLVALTAAAYVLHLFAFFITIIGSAWILTISGS